VLRFTVRRLAIGVLTIWVISVLTFVIIQLPPGDFVSTYIQRLQRTGGVTAETAERLRAAYGLDQPLYVQYGKWMNQVVHGDFGISFDWNKPVREVIGDRLPLTLVISVSAVIFIFVLALPIGILSAVRRYSFADHFFTFMGTLGLAIPEFLLALILLYVTSHYLGMDVGGLFSADYEDAAWSFGKVVDLIKHLPLPALILAVGGTAEVIRVMRANLLDELRKPYVVTARAKGLPERRLVRKYPVRVALNPFASSIGNYIPRIVSGAVIVSLVLNLPTVGPLLVSSLITQDMFLAGTIILMLGVMTVLLTLVSDIVLMVLDPRIRLHD
jgi:peptide/nickel transport system permease protein